ncbi:NAD(P)/FAD-dependent oxidoreductase [Bacillota bacterium Meth-B3]|nr:FAD-dependent oxidoreductase [Christensenellaceae bacterium]MEA5067299.1 FAD-dependent oxidoreductase [Eubacteriales bacterium]
MNYDVIIVGGGAAGLTAALYAARAGASTLLLEGTLIGGQTSTTDVLENYPGFLKVGGPELMMEMEKQAIAAGAEVRYESARAVDLNAKTVSTRKVTYQARAMILATGARRKKLGVPGEDALTGRGVSYCATCDGTLYKNKRVAIVGGGRTAVEDALYLANICEHVTIIHRRDSLRAEEAMIRRVLKHDKMTVLWNHVVSSMEEAEGGLKLNLNSTVGAPASSLECAGCFLAVGTEPVSTLYKDQLTLDEAGYVPAGEDTLTQVPGVFVAGDLRAKQLRQVVTAASDGAVAASEAAKYLNTLG